MEKAEVTEDFYLRDFERRNPNNYGNRHTDNHQPPCTPLRILAGNNMDIKDCIKELKDSIKELSEAQQDFREDMIIRIGHIEKTVSNQRSFVNGAGWILGVLVAAGIWLFDKLSPHIKL